MAENLIINPSNGIRLYIYDGCWQEYWSEMCEIAWNWRVIRSIIHRLCETPWCSCLYHPHTKIYTKLNVAGIPRCQIELNIFFYWFASTAVYLWIAVGRGIDIKYIQLPEEIKIGGNKSRLHFVTMI